MPLELSVPSQSSWAQSGTARVVTAEYIPIERAPASFYIESQFQLLSSLRELKALRALADDWNGYGAEAPSGDSIARSAQILRDINANRMIPSKILPSAEGGVAICFVRNGDYAQIECLNSGDTAVIVCKARQEPLAWEIETGLTDQTLKDIRLLLNL